MLSIISEGRKALTKTPRARKKINDGNRFSHEIHVYTLLLVSPISDSRPYISNCLRNNSCTSCGLAFPRVARIT